jgi:hypothetical protein
MHTDACRKADGDVGCGMELPENRVPIGPVRRLVNSRRQTVPPLIVRTDVAVRPVRDRTCVAHVSSAKDCVSTNLSDSHLSYFLDPYQHGGREISETLSFLSGDIL